MLDLNNASQGWIGGVAGGVASGVIAALATLCAFIYRQRKRGIAIKSGQPEITALDAITNAVDEREECVNEQSRIDRQQEKRKV